MVLRIHVINNFYSLNIGWSMLVLSTIGYLRENNIDFLCTIESLYPNVDSENYPFCKPVPPVKSSFRKLLSSTLRAILWRVFKALGVQADRLIDMEPLRRVKEADIVIDLSGDGLCPADAVSLRYRLRRTVSTLTNMVSIFIALILGKKVVLFSQSICNLGLLKPLAKLILRRVSLIVVRDDASYNYLSRLGVKNNVVLAADAALHLHAESSASSDKLTLCICPSMEAARFFYKQRFTSLIDTYVQLIEAINDRYKSLGLEIRLIPFSLGGWWFHEDDRLLINAILERLDDETKRRVQVVHDIKPDNVVSRLSVCSITVASRMHAAIASLINNVPVVVITHGMKFKTILEPFSPCVKQVKPQELSVNSLLESIDASIQSYGYCREEIKKRFSDVRERVRIGFKALEAIVHNVSKGN